MKKEAPPAAPKKGRPGYMPGDPQAEGPGLNDHRKHDEEYRKNAMFISHMAQVVDATPVEKQRKREIADVLEEIFRMIKDSERGIPPNQPRPGMVEENIANSLPDISDDQLKFLNKDYEKKALAIKEKKEKGERLTEEDQIVVKTYQAINMEFKRRGLSQQNSQTNQSKQVQNQMNQRTMEAMNSSPQTRMEKKKQAKQGRRP
jgi:hypothetical protein